MKSHQPAFKIAHAAILSLCGAFTLTTASAQNQATQPFSYLSPEDFKVELEVLQTEKSALLEESQTQVNYWNLRTDKLRSLRERGFATLTEVDAAALELAKHKLREAALTQDLRVITHAAANSESLARRAGTPDHSAVCVSLPGASFKVGGMQLSVLSAGWSAEAAATTASYLRSERAFLREQINDASRESSKNQDVLNKVSNLPKTYPLEVASAEVRAQQADTALAIVSATWRLHEHHEERLAAAMTGSELPWFGKPIGVTGAGWRAAVAPTKESLEISLPVLTAQSQADGRRQLLEVQLADAQFRLDLLIKAGDKSHEREVAEAKMEVAQIQHWLEAETARLNIAAQQVAIFGELTGKNGAIGEMTEVSAEGAATEVIAALDRLPKDAAWWYGMVRLAGYRQEAIADRDHAALEVAYREGLLKSYRAMKTARPAEIRRAELALARAQAELNYARQNAQMNGLEQTQWVALSHAKNDGQGQLVSATEWAKLGAASQAQSKGEATARQHELASAKARVQFCQEKVTMLEKIYPQSVSDYEMKQARLTLQKAQGEALSIEREIGLLDQSAGLLASIWPSESGTAAPIRIENLEAGKIQSLVQLAAEFERPDDGILMALTATRDLSAARSAKLADLGTKGFASSREIDASQAETEHYIALVTVEEQKMASSQEAAKLASVLFEKPAPGLVAGREKAKVKVVMR